MKNREKKKDENMLFRWIGGKFRMKNIEENKDIRTICITFKIAQTYKNDSGLLYYIGQILPTPNLF